MPRAGGGNSSANHKSPTVQTPHGKDPKKDPQKDEEEHKGSKLALKSNEDYS